MKTKPPTLSLHLIAALLVLPYSASAVIIDMDFEGNSGTTVSNAGTAGNGTMIGTGGQTTSG